AVHEDRRARSAVRRQSGFHTSLGQAYLHAQKWADAGTEFDTELKLDSQNGLAWLGLANLQLAKGEATAVLESLAKIWEISPEFLVAHRALPSIELPQDSASASISRVQSEAENPAKHFLLAGLYAAPTDNALSDRPRKSL